MPLTQRPFGLQTRLDEFEKRREKNKHLGDIERDELETQRDILEKARLQRDEEEGDIKKINELILNAKCVAVRDLQIKEKVRVAKRPLLPLYTHTTARPPPLPPEGGGRGGRAH